MFDYNKTPLAPLGTKAFVHERSTQRKSHADHGKIGYVTGPSLEHYRHLQFYIPETRGTRVTDTYVFIPTKFELPKNAAADRATQALEEFIQAINSKKAQQIPFSDKSINKAIEVLSKLLSPNNQPDTNKVAPGPRVVECPRVQAKKNKSTRQ